MAGVDMVRMMQTAQSKVQTKAEERSLKESKTAFSSLMQQSSQKASSAESQKSNSKIDAESGKSGSDTASRTEKTDQKERSEQIEQTENSEQTESSKQTEESKQDTLLATVLQAELQNALGQWMAMQNQETEPGADMPKQGLETALAAESVGIQIADGASENPMAAVLQESFTESVSSEAGAKILTAEQPEFSGGVESEKAASEEWIPHPKQDTASIEQSQKVSETESEGEAAATDRGLRLLNADQNEKESVFSSDNSEEEKAETSSENTQTLQMTENPTAAYSSANDRNSDFLASVKTTETVHTAPETFAQDLGTSLAQKLPAADGTLELELEPASLGKLTLKIMYEGERATVSIQTTNPKTLELLSQSADEIAQILKQRTGQETVIYTPQTEQQQDWTEGRNQENRREPQEQEKRQQDHTQSFAQQLRLGLI